MVEDSGATIDDNKNEGLGKNGVTASVDWDNLSDWKLFVKLYMVRILVHVN